MIDHELETYKKLTGKYKHFCYEWDGMAIDETYPEFLHCTCWTIPDEERQAIDKKLREIEVRLHTC